MTTKHSLRRPLILVTTLALAAASCSNGDGPRDREPSSADPAEQGAAGRESDDTLIVYARDREIAEPLFELFERETGIEVRARWGSPVELADQIIEDGADSPADVLYAPFSDALGSLSAAGRLTPLPDELLDRVPEAYRAPDGTWVGTSSRAHVVFYNTDKVSEDDLPDSILGFADPAWQRRIGWDPTSRSLQSAVTALTQVEGEDAARAWLEGIQANEPAAFGGATPVVTAVAAGEIIEVGFGSHYYLDALQAEGEAMNVAAKFYSGDPGGVLNTAGVGIVEGTANETEARAFVDFMLSQPVQEYFAEDAFEIPLVQGTELPAGMPTLDELTVPDLDVEGFNELDEAVQLLTDLGILT